MKTGQPWPPSTTLTELADIVIVMLDKQGNITNINHFGCQLLEYEALELIGKNWVDLCIPQVNQTEVRNVFRQLFDGESLVEHYQNAVVSSSGREYTLNWHNLARKDSEGNTVGTLSTGIDVSDALYQKQRAAETLELAQAKTRVLLENTAEGIIGSDNLGAIISFNKTAENMFGYRSEEVLGQNVQLLMPSPHREQHDRYIQSYIKTGKKKIIGTGRELTAVRKDGGEFPIFLIVTDTVFNGEHLFTGLIKDLTHQKAIETQLIEKENEIIRSRERLAHISRVATLGEITAGIAHEVNQPLAAIATYAQAARRLGKKETFDTHELSYVLTQIERQAIRASEVIQRLRNLAKQGDGHQELTSINTLIEDSIGLIATEAENHNVRFKLQLDKNLPLINVDTVQIQQVLINLILNAMQAMENTEEQTSCVTLTSSLETASQIRVSVSDNGKGMNKADRDKIFTPFFTTKKNGLGIGLSICRSLVSAHGGTLNINHHKRKGSEFFFLLPIANTVEGASNG